MIYFIRFFIGVLVFTISGCTFVPNDGPLSQQITYGAKAADGKSNFSVIPVSENAIKVLSKYQSNRLDNIFGSTISRGSSSVGIGDVLAVTIFEAGPDGLFSTTDKKSVELTLVVDFDGRIPIPFDGTVRVAGRSLQQIRKQIIENLKGRAVEPDVIVTLKQNNSRTATVNGSVRSPGRIPLVTGKERVLDVLALSGGPSHPPYNSYLSFTRRGVTRKILLQRLIDRPSQNIYVHSKDRIYVIHEPRTFSSFGAVNKQEKIPFGASDLNLVEAAAMAGGLEHTRADPGGYFVFRYEDPKILKGLIGDEALRKLKETADISNESGKLPVVYQIDMGKPNSYLLAQRFLMRNKDVIYVARKFSVDLLKFSQILTTAHTQIGNIKSY